MRTPLVKNSKSDILIVDDVPDNIRFLSNFLIDQGYYIRKAISGKMALGAIQALMPDLILLDINMTDMSGYEVCSQIKANPATHSIPIIFLSAGNEIIDKVKAFEVGGVDYITKPFQLEEVLIRIQTQLTIRDLQNEVEERNLQLEDALTSLKTAQAHLVQQEKMATLKKVVAGVAHEINNPLSFILGNTEPARQYITYLFKLIDHYQQAQPQTSPEIQALLNEADLEFVVADLDNLMQSMKKGAARIHSVISALKNFTHLDEAGVKQTHIQINIENTLTLLQYRLESKHNPVIIHVQKEYADLPFINCYADQFNQAIFNLISNAIDAVEIKLHHSDAQYTNPQIFVSTQLTPEQTILIQIKDNGIGISEANQDRLFEPFFTTKPAGQGVGLGLVTCRRIIEEMHHGKLSYHSIWGEGTEFSIELPMTLSIA